MTPPPTTPNPCRGVSAGAAAELVRTGKATKEQFMAAGFKAALLSTPAPGPNSQFHIPGTPAHVPHAAQREATDPVPTPKASVAAPKATRAICAGLTSTGTPCKRVTSPDSEYCAAHVGQASTAPKAPGEDEGTVDVDLDPVDLPDAL